MNRALTWTGCAGIASVAVYVAATAAGSWLDPAYSQVADHVSDLTASGAPTRLELTPAFLLYNACCAAFAVALYRASDRGRWFKAGTALLLVNVAAGVMMVTFFAEDLGGKPRTFTGQGHVVFAAVSSLAVVTGSVVYGVAFRRPRLWHDMSAYSFLTAVAFVIVAPLAIVTTAANTYAGFAERVTIAPFLLWLLVVGCHALVQARRRPNVRGVREGRNDLTGSVVVRLMGVESIRREPGARP